MAVNHTEVSVRVMISGVKSTTNRISGTRPVLVALVRSVLYALKDVLSTDIVLRVLSVSTLCPVVL
jgi:hypothetical protein